MEIYAYYHDRDIDNIHITANKQQLKDALIEDHKENLRRFGYKKKKYKVSKKDSLLDISRKYYLFIRKKMDNIHPDVIRWDDMYIEDPQVHITVRKGIANHVWVKGSVEIQYHKEEQFDSKGFAYEDVFDPKGLTYL